ncbi:MAG: chemotaxis protein CheC [Lachnospiraceae bacterium]|nr:chemotaxis protein CheC [Lachnospiraceae bacterium]MBQ2452865.1 chemotaxis protein CheC [Lachnospiraceae bacterium]MBQ4243153.1 chemotaxis protein CheC [Lachnospiraceae bacterium]
MAELDLNNVDAMYYDVLREIGNIGAGNAATALATMIGTKVDMTVPKVELVEFSEMGEALGGEEQIMAGIYLQISGDITGSIMFLLEEKSAHDLVSRLMGGGEAVFEEGQPFNEMEQSALSEIGNIIVGSYLNSLSMLTGLKIIESVPSLAMDMAEALLSVPAIEFGMVGDKMLLIQTSFSEDTELNGYFVLTPDLESYGKLLKALGVMQ